MRSAYYVYVRSTCTYVGSTQCAVRCVLCELYVGVCASYPDPRITYDGATLKVGQRGESQEQDLPRFALATIRYRVPGERVLHRSLAYVLPYSYTICVDLSI